MSKKQNQEQAIIQYIGRAELLGIQTLREKDLYVPEWKAHVKLRELSLEAADRLMQSAQERPGDNFQLGLMCLIESLVEPKLDPGDIPALMKKSAEVMSRLSLEALMFSGLRNRPTVVEEARGN